jgi:hypothetical protein
VGFISIIPTKIRSSFYLLIPKTIADITNVNDHTKFLVKISYGANARVTIIQQKKRSNKKKIKKKRSSKKRRRTK